MEERRVTQRRKCTLTPPFPLHTGKGGLLPYDRRSLPTRRVNDFQVEEISYREFLSRLH
jgi:hypothetical protein